MDKKTTITSEMIEAEDILYGVSKAVFFISSTIAEMSSITRKEYLSSDDFVSGFAQIQDWVEKDINFAMNKINQARQKL